MNAAGQGDTQGAAHSSARPPCMLGRMQAMQLRGRTAQLCRTLTVSIAARVGIHKVGGQGENCRVVGASIPEVQLDCHSCCCQVICRQDRRASSRQAGLCECSVGGEGAGSGRGRGGWHVRVQVPPQGLTSLPTPTMLRGPMLCTHR